MDAERFWREHGIPVTNGIRILEHAILDFEGGRASVIKWFEYSEVELFKIIDLLQHKDNILATWEELRTAIYHGTHQRMWMTIDCLHTSLTNEIPGLGITFVEGDVVPDPRGENGGKC